MKNLTTTQKETLERIINQNVLTLANTTGELYLNAALGGIGLGDQSMPEVHNLPEDEEIMQFFIVSDWLAEKLKENNRPVLETDDLYFYCRTQCGISLEDGGDFDFLLED